MASRADLAKYFWKHRWTETTLYKRPPGVVAVRYRRTGVVPATFDVMFPLWAVSRLRWQFRKPKTWSVEVTTEGRFSAVLNREVFTERVPDRGAAWALAQAVAARVEQGDFDEAILAAKR